MSKYVETLIKFVSQDTLFDGSSLTPGWMFHPIPFPEYAHIPSHKKQCIEELEVIQSNYDFRNKQVLEIGSAGGYFTFNIAEKCKYIYAFEADPYVYSVTQAITEEKEINNIYFHYGRFNEYALNEIRRKFDVCIIMNVHMWLVKALGFDRTKELMRDICKRCPKIFFQTAHKESASMYIVDELTNRVDIIKYLYEVGYNKVIHIYTSMHDGKPRFLFKGMRT